MPRPEWIEVGRISRPHGVNGEVRVSLSSDNPGRYVQGARFHARPGRLGIAGPRPAEQVRLTVESIRGDEDFPIVAFREIADRDGAEAFCGYVLEVRSSQLPELDDDEFYPFDLVGLEARDPAGAVVGRVTEMLETPAHALLVLSLDSGGEGLIPFVKAAVPLVTVDEAYLVIDPALISVSPGENQGSRDQAEQRADGGPE